MPLRPRELARRATTCIRFFRAKPVARIRSSRSRAGVSAHRRDMCPLVALPSCERREPSRVQGDDLPPEMMIGGVPGWAMDIHTRRGRAAFARFLETDAPSARWVRAKIRPARRVPFFGHVVFHVESGLVVNRLRWPLGDELRRKADVECSYPELSDDTEILELTRADLPVLDEVRAEMAGGVNHAS